ncbi:MAG: tyrosine-type recombinase/integrase [Eubacteriales bacterium]|nr:tyrosine-type recombinase/integrase [Eubacteriales bacterium]
MAAKKRTDNKGRILRTGEMQRAEDNRYLYRYVDLSGKKRTVYALTLGELREREKQINRDLQDGIDTSKEDMTLNELFRLYMDTKTDLRESTRCNYIAAWKNAVESSILGNMKIAQIKQIHVRAFYADLAKRGMAANTIKYYHGLIFPALELAVDSDIIRKNPAKGCKKGVGGTKRERTSMTIAEQERMMTFVKNSTRYSVYYPMIVFALSTGLRVGELAGLRWADVDMKENVIHVRQQLIYRNLGDGCQFHIQDLKTEAGRRDIPLTASARKSLIRQKEITLLLGKSSKRKEVDGISDFVFTNTQGTPYAANAVNFILKNIVKSYNRLEEIKAAKEHREAELLPHISAHILRHTACTRLAESGLEPKVLQYIMGHANLAVTMDIYTHLDFTQIQEKMEAVQERTRIG